MLIVAIVVVKTQESYILFRMDTVFLVGCYVGSGACHRPLHVIVQYIGIVRVVELEFKL
jgi:hypothetical protein